MNIPPLRRWTTISASGGNMGMVGRATFGAALAALVLLGTASIPASASQGSPDKTFGTAGRTTTPGGSTGYLNDLALQPDGKIIGFGARGGFNPEPSFVRYTATGALDETFGNHGIVDMWFGPGGDGEVPDAVVLRPDGKIVGVASYGVGASAATGIVRLNTDGSPDATFGTGGKVVYQPASTFTAYNASLLSDGRLSLVGEAKSTLSPGTNKAAMAILGADGTPDATFGTGGLAIAENASYNSLGIGVVEQGTNFLVAGDRDDGSSEDLQMVRFNASGQSDTTFGAHVYDLGANDEAWDVAAQSDGKIVLAGTGLNASGTHTRTELIRTSANGALDTSFGVGGIVSSPFDDSAAYSVAIDSDGKIVLGGDTDGNFLVQRKLSGGSPDVAFGCLGSVESDFGGDDSAYTLTRQSDGRIVAAGTKAYLPPASAVEDFALARYEPDGGPGACGYELDGQGGLHRFGIGNPATPPVPSGATFWSGKDVARGVAVSPTAGGVVVDITGALHPFAIPGVTGKPVVGSAGAMPAPNLARGVAMLPNGKGGYVLDGWGGMHPFAIGNNPKPPAVVSPSWTNWNIARGVTILPDGTGGYIIDAWGGLHPFAIGNNARPPAASGGYWKGWDIARGVTVLADGTGGYVLDGWGGMHAFAIGNNPRPPAATAGYWQGWDIARGVAALP